MNQLSKVVWQVPKTGAMRVPIRLYANERILPSIDEQTIEQARNVASMPGIVGDMLLFSDAHVGYGMPVGGTAAFDEKEGVISPAAVGYDIGCGMRLMTTNLTVKQVRPKLKQLVDELFKAVPVGVGRKGVVDLSKRDLDSILTGGAKWCVKNDWGWKEDLERIEGNGFMKGADPEKVSDKALERGREQLGTLGSGNHYLEIQLSSAKGIFNPPAAKAFGITGGDQVVVMIHCGSRGFGHQVCTDYAQAFVDAMPRQGISGVERDLACAYFQSQEGQDYYAAMACAANNAIANRQVIMQSVRNVFEKVFGNDAESMKMQLTYDVAHNLAKREKHAVDGRKQWVIVHRKGATRGLGPGTAELTDAFQKTGQPVIVGGSMETGSFVCAGTKKAMEETFGSTLHGSGRTMSRTKAKEMFGGEALAASMLQKGILVKAASLQALAEEAGGAYKDINDVIETMHAAGISLKVASLAPIGNIKG